MKKLNDILAEGLRSSNTTPLRLSAETGVSKSTVYRVLDGDAGCSWDNAIKLLPGVGYKIEIMPPPPTLYVELQPSIMS